MKLQSISLSDLCARLEGARLEGDGNTMIHAVAGLKEAGPGALSFLANPRYVAALAETRASAVIIGQDAPAPPEGIAAIRVAHPYLMFARALTMMLPTPRHPKGVQQGAWVDDTAQVHPSATVYPGAFVGAGARVGSGSVLFPGVVVLHDAAIGADCLLYPGVMLREECTLGDRVILHGNVTIGGDGYGFAQHEGRHEKIPQIGTVRVEDDVEIGAGTCIDRAAMGATVIGRGTKIDDLVMIGHGCQVGEHVLIVAQSGMAGSAVLEDGVVVGARGGVLGHLTVGAGSLIFSRSHVTKTVPPGSQVSGNPARPHAEQLRQEALIRRLDGLVKKVAALEKEVALLKGEGK